MRRTLAIIFLISLASSASSQTMLDVSKITCDQYVHSKIATPNYIAAWMSGYFSAKRKDTMLDTQALQERVSKLERFCYEEKNFKIPVMKAIESLFPSAKG